MIVPAGCPVKSKAEARQHRLGVPWCSGPSYRVLVPVTEVRILPGLPLSVYCPGIVSEVSSDVLLVSLEGAAPDFEEFGVSP